MPLTKPYPPIEIDYEDWNDLADNYAGKAATLIVDVNGKGDHSTIQEAVDALPSTNAGEILIKGARDGTYEPKVAPVLFDLAAQIAAGRKAIQERELNALRTNWE